MPLIEGIGNPGPASVALIEKLNPSFDARSTRLVIDYDRSHDNYIVDIDGNEYLDVYAQIASVGVGYNNTSLIKMAKSDKMISALVNRPAIGNFPSKDWLEVLSEGLLRVAPAGLNRVFTAQSGSEANELAFKAAFMLYRRHQRGEGVSWSQEDIDSCMDNATPGSPQLSVLSFRNSFHGRGFGSLSATRSKTVHKLDIPAFNWPQADFPSLRYPLESFQAENEKEETRCLTQVEQLITSWSVPVAAVIVEPIQSEGGDNYASASFFQGLRNITARHHLQLIVDEVQTGFGATGSFWAHDHWKLTSPPDMVTFSKKAQTAGYFFGDELLVPDKPYRQFNTWMGDPARVLFSGAVIEEIMSRDLVTQCRKVGKSLYIGLEALASQYPVLIRNLRGKDMGTYIAFDTADSGRFMRVMQSTGVIAGTCGQCTVRFRPMLIFSSDLVPKLLEVVRQTCLLLSEK